MCLQIDMALHMQKLYLQGMPRKIGKKVESTLKKKQKLCTDLNCQNRNNCSFLSENNDIEMMTSTNTNDSVNNNSELVQSNTANSLEVVQKSDNDLIAKFTILTRSFCQKANAVFERAQNSNQYKVLSKTTQPAHVIAIGILSFVLLAVWPNIIDDEASLRPKGSSFGLASVAYLATFAIHFGAQIWMTFVSGLALYFSLPRHTFGLCQQILFPKYFALNSILSICTLIMFIKVFGGHWEFSSIVQVIALTTCAVIEVAVRLYLAPPLLKLMREKYRFEVTIGSGKEIGQIDQGDLTKCPHYMKIHKSFRRIHMTVAMGNLTVLVCTFLHLHYLASKISVRCAP